jgi:hypothetical protein
MVSKRGHDILFRPANQNILKGFYQSARRGAMKSGCAVHPSSRFVPMGMEAVGMEDQKILLDMNVDF